MFGRLLLISRADRYSNRNEKRIWADKEKKCIIFAGKRSVARRQFHDLVSMSLLEERLRRRISSWQSSLSCEPSAVVVYFIYSEFVNI